MADLVLSNFLKALNHKMIKNFCNTACCFLLGIICASAQVVGGRNSYDFLSLSFSARATALGGNLITVRDNDLGLVLQNPAVLNQEMHHSATIQQSVYFSGITFGHAGYAYHLKKIPLTVHAGIQYISYGKFQRTNSIGEEQGDFKASDNALVASLSYRATDRLSFGSSQKIVISGIEGYNSIGWASDWAAMYADTAKRLTFSLVLKNIGTQFTTYGKDGKRYPLPFDAQFGMSHRLKYLPLRFSIIGHHLHRWNIRYDDPALDIETVIGPDNNSGNNKVTFGEVVDNIFRHLTFNFELLLGKKEVFRIRAGYDRLRQGEMGVSGLRSLAGFSAGFGVKIYKFNIDYGFSSQHLGGTMHHFGISTRLTDF
jgi:hypothetical protein